MRGLLLLLVLCAVADGWFFGSKIKRECFGLFGCFDNDTPFDNTKGCIPQTPEEQGMQLALYTRENKYYPQWLNTDDDRFSISQSNYAVGKRTYLIIHGYTDDCLSEWVANIERALLDIGDFNVFRVNWQLGASPKIYDQAASNTRLVASMLATFLQALNEMGTHYSDMHVIGHSLGAHISGQVGQRLHGQLGRITGMDPAGPSFDRDNTDIRLDKTDAMFVDVLHTDAEHLIKLGFGMMRRMGHADFYPAGGFDQEGCPKNAGDHLFELVTGGIKGLINGASCSHSRAVDFFWASIAMCHYTAVPCDNWADFKAGKCSCSDDTPCSRMGYFADRNLHGTFFLKTAGNPPYC
ncbi:pancreatic lipase-related protein 2-like [Haliotis rufescens]|uniref:pancreatic lipase-related protein 2-like n=1 Tax=Haliotis rufescens TaxID=6454 RepID=UPI00201F5F6E|nr:pancreatic lipase-related protein 2-like [Haliotis rufescens]